MKRLFRCLMAMSFLAISSATFSQPGYARQEQQNEKKDEMKKDAANSTPGSQDSGPRPTFRYSRMQRAQGL